MQRYFTVTALGLLFVLASCSDPDDVPDSHLSTTPVSPVAEAEITRNPNKNAYFGDLHVHTSWSIDAYAGESRVGPATAYRFARGDMVELPNGSEAKLDVPLDFVAITDHAEGFATHLVCTIPGNPEFDTDTCRRVRADLDQETLLENAFERGVSRPSSRDPVLCTEERMDWCLEQERSTWQRFQELANAYNDPGNFTTLIGYEFSALLPDFGMLHRNVIFRGSDVIAKAIDEVHASIREGESIARPLQDAGVFDDMMINMVDIGEETGELDKMLIKIADNYDDDVDIAVESLSSIIEPILIVGMGGAVGFIVIALFLPLISLIEKL